jgi:tetratricopeptide (TPR) repeat protein
MWKQLARISASCAALWLVPELALADATNGPPQAGSPSADGSGNAKADLEVTRALATEGLIAFDEGRYDEAFLKLERAYRAVQLPTLGLYSARAATKLGRLVTATQLYKETVVLLPEADWQPAQHEAQEGARLELERLLPRVPRITIRTRGCEGHQVRVVIDGVRIPTALLSSPQLVDPGIRDVKAHCGAAHQSKAIYVVEGRIRGVDFEFVSLAEEPAALKANPYVEEPAALKANPYVEEPTAMKANPYLKDTPPQSKQPLIGWLTFGAGAGAVVAGGIVGLTLAGDRETLKADGCDDQGQCYTDQADAVAAYNTKRSVSMILEIGGAAVASLGVALVLTTPRSRSPQTGAMALTLRPDFVSLAGGF